MDNPILRAYTEKKQPLVITEKHWFSAKVLAICGASLLLIILFSSCNMQPARAEVDLTIIAQIESSGNPNAYNKSSGAIGLMQITPICLEEFNNLYVKQFRKKSLDNQFANIDFGGRELNKIEK